MDKKISSLFSLKKETTPIVTFVAAYTLFLFQDKILCRILLW